MVLTAWAWTGVPEASRLALSRGNRAARTVAVEYPAPVTRPVGVVFTTGTVAVLVRSAGLR